MHFFRISNIFCTVLAGFALCFSQQQQQGARSEGSKDSTVQTPAVESVRQGLSDGLYAEIKTNKGTIICALEFKKTPVTVANFVGLAEGTIPNIVKKEGEPYYDGIQFHRVVPNFIIQGGDPTATGRGGPGYMIPDEFDYGLQHDGPGILSMANAGPNTNGSQFFITHQATPHLDGKHTVFGHVVEGMDVVLAIQQGDSIEKMSILRAGEEAELFRKGSAESFSSLLEIIEKAAQTRKEDKALKEKLNAQTTKIIEAKYPDAKKTKTGLMYVLNKNGKGKKPSKGALVTIQYTGKLMDGKVFGTTKERKKPFQFKVGAKEVNPGLDEAVLSMEKGESRTLIIPPELGYGSSGGAGGLIPPDSWLIIDVELIDF